MRIGIFLGEANDLEHNVQQVVGVEQDGFDGAWFGQIFGADAMTALALAGARTNRIELGTAVIPTYPRHPYVLAQQALTVQVATGGRFTLGIGPSHQPVVETFWGLSYERPARHVRQYLSVLRPLVHEGRAQTDGDLFRVNASLRVNGAKPPPILIAALAPVMLRIAGEMTEGTITWMTGPKTIESHIAPRISAAAKVAGRPAPRVCVGLPIAVTGDAAAARERAAQAFQLYGQLPNYRRVLDKEGAKGPADVAIIGDEAEVEKQVRALASTGATDFLAAEFPVEDDAEASLARTRALLKSLVGKV